MAKSAISLLFDKTNVVRFPAKLFRQPRSRRNSGSISTAEIAFRNSGPVRIAPGVAICARQEAGCPHPRRGSLGTPHPRRDIRRHAHADFESFRVAIGFITLDRLEKAAERAARRGASSCGWLRARTSSACCSRNSRVRVDDRCTYVFAFLQSLYEFNLVLANSTGPDTSRKS